MRSDQMHQSPDGCEQELGVTVIQIMSVMVSAESHGLVNERVSHHRVKKQIILIEGSHTLTSDE